MILQNSWTPYCSVNLEYFMEDVEYSSCFAQLACSFGCGIMLSLIVVLQETHGASTIEQEQ